MVRLRSFVATSLLLVACGGAVSPSRQIPLEQEITLAPGERVGTAELRVTFDRVGADSRCPSDVRCIWEGDASVVLGVEMQGAAGCALELHTAATLQREGRCGAHGVRLVRLVPEPVSAAPPIPPASYRATLIVFAAR